MFLAVTWDKVIDVHAKPGVAATDEAEAIPAVEEESHEEIQQSWIEDSGEQVARNLANGVDTEYYDLVIEDHTAVIGERVRIKSGERRPAVKKEIAEAETSRGLVGQAEVDA